MKIPDRHDVVEFMNVGSVVGRNEDLEFLAQKNSLSNVSENTTNYNFYPLDRGTVEMRRSATNHQAVLVNHLCHLLFEPPNVLGESSRRRRVAAEYDAGIGEIVDEGRLVLGCRRLVSDVVLVAVEGQARLVELLTDKHQTGYQPITVT